jgi:fibronectin type 3 domain-containing protein
MKKFAQKVIIVNLAVSFIFILFASLLIAGDVKTAPVIMKGFPILSRDNYTIAWLPSEGAVKYKIYQNGKHIGDASELTYTASNPKESGNYKYTITGVDANGVEGLHSKEGILSFIKLEQPKNLKHRNLPDRTKGKDQFSLFLSWDPAPTAVSYDIYRADAEVGQFKLMGSDVKNASFKDPDIDPLKTFGKSFFYKIISTDKFNKKSSGTEVYEVKVGKVRLMRH